MKAPAKSAATSTIKNKPTKTVAAKRAREDDPITDEVSASVSSRAVNKFCSSWLLEKSKMINLQMLIKKSTFNVLSSCCPLKNALSSAMYASVSLARKSFWHMRKPGI